MADKDKGAEALSDADVAQAAAGGHTTGSARTDAFDSKVTDTDVGVAEETKRMVGVDGNMASLNAKANYDAWQNLNLLNAQNTAATLARINVVAERAVQQHGAFSDLIMKQAIDHSEDAHARMHGQKTGA